MPFEGTFTWNLAQEASERGIFLISYYSTKTNLSLDTFFKLLHVTVGVYL